MERRGGRGGGVVGAAEREEAKGRWNGGRDEALEG